MGVVRYLCITILLVSLVFAAPDCSGNGWVNSGGVCVCTSGFDGADCSNYFGACETDTHVASNKKDERFPKLDTTNHVMKFQHNYLNLSIVGPVVPNRTYTNIAFVDQTSDSCKLNGTASYWTQFAATCGDEFQLRMPWSAWKACGFGPQPKGKDIGDFWEYRATFVIYYTDDVGQPFKFDDIPDYQPKLVRHSTVAYKVWVHFRKIVELQISQVLVNSTIDLSAAITKFEYDPSTQFLTLGVKSIMSWPNKYIRNSVSIEIMNNAFLQARYPFGGNVLVATPKADDSVDSCAGGASDNTIKSFCMQYWEVQIFLPDGNCDFNAEYKLTGTARTCRDGDLNPTLTSGCTDATQEAILKVSHSDVCGTVTANPEISGKLVSYDSNHQLQDEFVVGYKGYFEVDMTTDNSFNLTWVDIWVTMDTVALQPVPAVQWLLKDGEVRTKGFYKQEADGSTSLYPDNTFSSSPVQLVVHDISQNDNVNAIVLTPKFELRFDSRIFHIAFTPNGQVKRGFQINAIGKITYRGNEQYDNKRTTETVDFVWASDAKDMMTKAHVGLSTSESVAAAQTTSAGPAAYYFYAPVAGLACVIVAAAVVAAVVAKKRQSTSFTTLAN